jgi:hypothetical protein
MTSSENIKAKQRAFNAYYESVVQPLIGLSSVERGKLTSADEAKRIDDPAVRKRYCELAIAMLDANISHCRPDATMRSVPVKNNTAVVASTFVASAMGYYAGGGVVALVIAGIWYWLADTTAKNRVMNAAEAARAHNELVPEWMETLQGWELDRDELRSV